MLQRHRAPPACTPEKKDIMIETRLLEYFLAVAREQNITRAAQSLHITQPTLSKQMMDLEAQLGRQLLVRGKRQVTLTEDGRYLRARAQEIVDLVQKTESTFDEAADDVSGEVHLACGETRWMGHIAEVMHAIMIEHPAVRFHLHSGDAETVYDRLEKGLADAGLLMGPTRDSRYEYFDLNKQDRYGLMVPRTSDLATRTSISTSILPTLPLLFPEQVFRGNQHLNSAGVVSAEMNITGVYNLLYNATHMVEHDMGYAFCLEGLIDEDTARNLRFVPLQPEVSINLVMVTKRYQTFSPAVRLFLERLQNAAIEQPGPMVSSSHYDDERSSTHLVSQCDHAHHAR